MPAVTSQLIRVGHSPDPDDAFMFYALAKEKIPMRGFRVEHVIEDIESLNQRALGHGARSMEHGVDRTPHHAPCAMPHALEVTAVSCHAYAYLADQYVILRSGASVGDNYGPILVAKNEHGAKSMAHGVSGGKTHAPCAMPHAVNLRGKRIAIPGELTTAYLVLKLYETKFEPVFIPFDQILDAVVSGKVDLGLVIHEGQMTYKEHGLENVLDLGKWWQEKTKLPLPLGIDVIRRDLGIDVIKNFSALFKESIQYALDHRKEALQYALEFGRGISENLGDRFVGMYVNDYTVDLGAKGERGLRRLLDAAYEKGLIPRQVALEFV